MTLQLIFVLLFALNLLLLWAAILSKKALWYRFAAYFFMLVIPMLTVILEQPHFDLDYFWWRIAGYAAIALGAAAIIWARTEFKKQKVDWRAAEPAKLVTSGPYQFLRHPIYLGLIFILVGWWWIWAAAWSFYFGMLILLLIWIQGNLEEWLILQKKFGEAFTTYRKTTGMYWIK
jgi:protein-S-isoprenylcysteine O-methyltransferase Ste14